MRVAYVTMQFPAPRETFALLDVTTLRARGVDVAVYALRGERSEAAELTRQWRVEDLAVTHGTVGAALRGASVALRRPRVAAGLIARLAVDNWRSPAQLVKSLALVPRALDVFDRIARDRPDVVHLFWGHHPAIVGRLVWDHAPGIVVTQFLGAYDLTQRFRTGTRLAAELPLVFTHAHANVALLVEAGVAADRVRVVHRGIAVEGTPPPLDGRRRYGLLSAGGFHEGKGFREVVEVFARVQRVHPDASLTLLGDGPDRAELERRVAAAGLRNVSMPGFVPHRHVLDEMARAEVFLFLSRSAGERLPNVVKEAMLAGCVCVSSDSVGIDELIEDGVSGHIVGALDTAAAADRVLAVLDDAAQRRRLAEAARARITSEFDVRRAMDRYVAEWTRLAASR